jgi:hypothetical protein
MQGMSGQYHQQMMQNPYAHQQQQQMMTNPNPHQNPPMQNPYPQHQQQPPMMPNSYAHPQLLDHPAMHPSMMHPSVWNHLMAWHSHNQQAAHGANTNGHVTGLAVVILYLN